MAYKVNPNGRVRFRTDIPIRLECALEQFAVVVEPPVATVTPTVDFPTIEAARASLEPQLESWRIWVQLTEEGDLLPFEFQDGAYEVCNVSPNTGHLFAASASMQIVGQAASLFQCRSAVPPPPKSFITDDLVRVGSVLYVDAETLPRHSLKIAFAYLSIIEAEHGDQPSAARKLAFSNRVLGEFKELSSRGGTPLEARKVHRKRAHRIELTDDRRSWLLRVFRELILRQGQLSAHGEMPPEFSELCPGPPEDFPNTRRA
jgi:hypothetical protein